MESLSEVWVAEGRAMLVRACWCFANNGTSSQGPPAEALMAEFRMDLKDFCYITTPLRG